MLQSGQILGLLCAFLVVGLFVSYAFKQRGTNLCFLVAFTGLALALLAVAFSVTWLNGFISEPRHLMIIPLLIIPILVFYLWSSGTIMATTAALLILMAPVWRALVQDDRAASSLVPLNASISPIPGFGQTATINGKMLIGPIRWEEPQVGYSSTGVPEWSASQSKRVAVPGLDVTGAR